MKIINLLNDIENDEIEDGTIFEVIGDFFYKLIVIDKNLYYINEMTKKLEILDSKYIGRFDNRQYEIIELSNKTEEEKKIPEKIKTLKHSCNFDRHEEILYENQVDLANKITEILDYLKSKGE